MLSSRLRRVSWSPRLRFFSTLPSTATDAFGRTWTARRSLDSESRVLFYYDPSTFDSCEVIVQSRDKPEYATQWVDERFPAWVQYLEIGTKRPYFFDRANPNVVGAKWAPPDRPEYDVFNEEIRASKLPLRKVPEDAAPAALTRRAAALTVDLGVALAVGIGFGALVLVDIGRLQDSAFSVGTATWVAFLARDSVLERGTRSIGKKVMNIEIVRWDGQLPTRWHTVGRQIYLPLYFGATLLFPYIIALPILEVGMLLFTKNSYRLGDVLGQTKVITELPDREERYKEMCTRYDADDAKEQ